jgi:hypothetical protein
LDLKRLPAVVTRGYMAIAALGTIASVALHIATFGPAAWSPSVAGLWPLLFIAMFAVVGGVIVAVSLARIPFEILLWDLPLALKVAGGLGTAYVALNFALMFRALQGVDQPPMYVARLFTGHEMYFFGFATLIGYQLDRIRRGKLEPWRPPRDDALESDPLPWPLSRSAVLQTLLSRADCAARLLQLRLRGEATAEAFRLELTGPRSSLVYAVGRFEGSGPTFIRLLLTFKRWPLIAIGGTLVLLPLVWLMLGPVGFGWQGLLFVVVFAGGGNIVYGVIQMRRLQAMIQRATEAQSVSIG